ncbi:A24 family peptidase [Novosphingobium rosa]|uniref:A24 family peptidase n=1 Tax=Novosphingobium rosa TaxID=76978 RepID=UPI00082EF2AB|nr:prepilin peptidase [Novosphingobium rosa]
MMTNLLLIPFCLAGAVLDLRFRRLPNLLNTAMVICGLLVTASSGSLGDLASHAMHVGLALMAGGLLFYLGIVGGGDAKFYAAAAAWFGIGQAWWLALAIVFSGGVMAFCWMSARLLATRSISGRGRDGQRVSLPYGVPIAMGAMIVLAVQDSIVGLLLAMPG